MNELGLGIAFVGQDQFSGVMNAGTLSFNQFDAAVGRSQTRVMAHVDSMAVARKAWEASTSVLRGVFGLADQSGEFSQSVAAVGAVSGASAEQLRQLENAALDAGVATQFSPTQAVVGLGDLAQAGFDANESIALLGPTLDLAAGSLGKLTPSGAAGLAAQTMKAFSLGVDQAGVAVDQLLQSVNQFALSADELPLALGTAARGAQAMGQGLSETLLALGLVKNVIPGVERSATAVATAMEKMVKPETQQALRGLGVAVADAKGNFRPFLDVLQDLQPALAKMTQQGRGAFLTKAFGTESLAGIQAILQQIGNGIKGANGEIVRGRAAVDFLRAGMANAAGTAKNFAGALLDTFAGQKQLVKGSLETLAITIGKPFESALRPLVEGFLAVVNQVITAVRSIPAPMQAFIAQAIVAAGAIVGVIGSIIAAKAALAGIGSVLAAAGVSIGGVIAALVPAVAIFGVAAAAVMGFRQAVETNIGGLGYFMGQAFGKMRLAFSALMQVFGEGGFSGQVREDLGRAENMGLKNFVIRLFGIVERIKELFAGIGTGFSAAIDAAGRAFGGLTRALEGISDSFTGLFETNDAADAAASFENWGATGERVGKVLGKIVAWLAQIATGVITLATGFVAKWDVMVAAMEPAITAFQAVSSELLGIGDKTSTAGSDLAAFGTLIAYVVAIGIHAFGLLAGVVGHFSSAIIGGLRSVGTVLSGVVDIVGGIVNGQWGQVWNGFKKVALGAISFVLNSLLGFIEAFALISDRIAGLIGFDSNMAGTIQSLRKAATEGLIGTEMAKTAEAGVAASPLGTEGPRIYLQAASAKAAEEEVSRPEPLVSRATAEQTALGGVRAEQAAAAMMAASAEIARNSGKPGPTPVVNVMLDSAQISAQVQTSYRSEADNNFTPGLPVASGV